MVEHIEEIKDRVIAKYTNQKISTVNLAKELNIPEYLVRIILNESGVLKKHKKWTPEEDKFIIENYPKFGYLHCGEKLNRSPNSLRQRAKKLGLPPNQGVFDITNAQVEILIGWDEYKLLKNNDLVPFKCCNCNKLSHKKKKYVNHAIRRKNKHLICSHSCNTNFMKQKGKLLWPTREKIQELIDKDYSTREIALECNISEALLFRVLKNYKLKTHFRAGNHNPETKKKVIEVLKKKWIEHPELVKLPYHISEPCEKLKKELRERGIKFDEEVYVALHINRLFQSDIVLEYKGVIIEVNGGQHYNYDGSLRPYFQKRHDFLVGEGWRVFEIPCQKIYEKGFVDNLIIQINDCNFTPSLEYKRHQQKKVCGCGKEITKYNKTCRDCRKKNTQTCPVSKEQLHWYLWNYTSHEILKIFKVRWTNLMIWIKNMNFSELPTFSYRMKITYGKITDYQI